MNEKSGYLRRPNGIRAEARTRKSPRQETGQRIYLLNINDLQIIYRLRPRRSVGILRSFG